MTEFSFEKDLENAVRYLKEGGLILYPTDTVWGIGCDATNEEAVKKIYELKKREDSKSMLVLAGSKDVIENIVGAIPPQALTLMDSAESPLTIIYQNAKNVAPNLRAEDGSLGIRLTKESFSSQLCRRFGKPVVSTSANISGQKTPTLFSEISDQIKDGVDYIVNYRREDSTSASPSNIIKFSPDGEVIIIR